jgi:hypothetical protein
MALPDIATIADLVCVHTAKRPDAIALVVGERNIAFAELDDHERWPDFDDWCACTKAAPPSCPR